MIFTHRTTLIWGLIVLAAGGVFAQTGHVPGRERVDPTLRRRTEIDGNNVRTSVFNFAFSGRTGAGQGVPYEWPKNTNRVYIALVSLFVGAEVTDNSGNRLQIVDLPAYRTNPANGADWNINPMPGYFNLTVGKIAKSDEPATWPDRWPDKANDPQDPGWAGAWNGFFGKNQFSADQEMFYRAGDDNYNRYNYSPDMTDPGRRGLGMVIDVRAMQWSQVTVADAIFFIQEVKNDGTKDLKKTAVTLWLADFVGGDGDSQDDSPSFDLIKDIAFSLDADGRSSNPAFQGALVGAAATNYLETPGNATDRIDNDGDSPEYLDGPKVTGTLFQARLPGTGPEVSGNQIDENRNGLIDEDSTHVPFGQQRGVGFADRIDNNGNGETGSPTVSATMVSQASLDLWARWPPAPEASAFQDSIIHLLGVGAEDQGKSYADNIDNDGDCLAALPIVTQAIVDTAALANRRYRVPGTDVILYDVGPEDIGLKYIDRDGLRDAGIDEGIDEMIDEGRNDLIDNDGDWNPLFDDVGLDGANGTGDAGEGDGRPTSGVGTQFPGEPNIDKTDVAEADQIGLTNVQYLPAGAINFSTTPDVFFWAEFMLPGSFVNPAAIPTGESDLFVSSGVFPMQAGQIERISYAVVFGAAVQPGNPDVSGARADALRKRDYATLAYQEDYQFAQAPVEPTVTAVTGDRRVTLYWDSEAEQSIDRFLQGIDPSAAKDFEGYRIYRATDPAFEDAQIITDGQGNPAPFLKPIQQYDLQDGISGYHPVDYNGVKFFMGTDTGLLHSWVDTSVQNGQKYYYAVRAYDKGYLPLNISPAESNLKISLDPVTGEVTSKGSSIAIVVPEASAAGYIPPSGTPAELVQGSTTGSVFYSIVDPDLIRDQHRYRVTFEDSVRSGVGSAPDTFFTKSYTLADVTNSSLIDTLLDRHRAVADTLEQPIVDGFQLFLRNERVFGVDQSASGWSRPGIFNYVFKQWKGGFIVGQQRPADYRIVFGPLGVDTSTSYVVRTNRPPLPSIPVNFRVFNTTENRQIDFAFQENDQTGGAGIFSASRLGVLNVSDIMIFLEPDLSDSLKTTWEFEVGWDSVLGPPVDGDSMTVVLSKIFSRQDAFEFTTTAQRVDQALAAEEIGKIKVVPNPYVAAATWEERNSYTSGRGPRSIHFIHLPQKCTIRIFTVSGENVKTIEHDSSVRDGTAEWDLLTRDNLAASYGVYVFHVDAPGVGEFTGKFAVIK